MKYEKAKAEVVLFDNSDVVTTSCTGPGTHSQGNGCKGGPNGEGEVSTQSYP